MAASGKRRYADGSDDPAGSIASQPNRGFTGHEELDSWREEVARRFAKASTPQPARVK